MRAIASDGRGEIQRLHSWTELQWDRPPTRVSSSAPFLSLKSERAREVISYQLKRSFNPVTLRYTYEK